MNTEPAQTPTKAATPAPEEKSSPYPRAVEQPCQALGAAHRGAQQFIQDKQDDIQIGSCGKALLI